MRQVAAVLTRFWRDVEKMPGANGCWEWRRNRTQKGYGQIQLKEDGVWKNVGTHRLSWSMHYGSIPSGMSVCHKCDNPGCVRPDHLFIGTVLDNARDASKKGRIYRPPLKTHCQQGHPFDALNTFIGGDGKRKCRTCRRKIDLVKYEAAKERRRAALSAETP